jgi:excisionase family DNA binding protein
MSDAGITMLLSVKQAAKAVGRSKPTILRAIQAHRISASKDELTGAWMIDPAELHRVYPPVSAQQVRTEPMTQDVSLDEAASLRRELALLTAERDREREQLQARIDDLSRRLDAEGEERRRLTAILTDQRAKAPDVIVTPPPVADPAPAAAPAAPAVVKVRPVKQPPAKGWFQRMMGGK